MCSMTFYYHMYGKDIGMLSIYSRTAVNGKLTRLWRKSGEVGNYYARDVVTLPLVSAASTGQAIQVNCRVLQENYNAVNIGGVVFFA